MIKNVVREKTKQTWRLRKKHNSAKNNFIKGSLLNYACLIKKDYVLIETTGQNNIEPIQNRVNLMNTIIQIIIKKYEII